MKPPSQPLVSVIIPCFNHGEYIEEAIDSAIKQTYQNFEIIVVDDGSTDTDTLQILKNINKPKTKIIFSNNQGVSAARNKAIEASNGQYILPLDADDKIHPTYLEKGVSILQNTTHGIVYCKGKLFGAETGSWNLPPFSHKLMVKGNTIFCSAFYSKQNWEKAGGYDEAMRKGWEDYEFWIGLLELNLTVYQIPEELFFYRIKPSSRNAILTTEDYLDFHQYIYKKHIDYFSTHIKGLFQLIYPESKLAPYLVNIFTTSKSWLNK